MTMRTSVKKTVQMGGKTFSETNNIEAEGAIVHEMSIPAAEPGELTTRNDVDTGVVTADESAHGITDSDVVDVYWSTGSRRGMNVDAVSGADINIDGGSGDDLPAQGTVVAIVVPTELDVVVLGTNVVAIALSTQARGQFVLRTSGAESLFQRLGDGVVWSWHEDDGNDNPVTGDALEIVRISHDDVSVARTMRVGVAYDN